jgi:hypothetical protein
MAMRFLAEDVMLMGKSDRLLAVKKCRRHDFARKYPRRNRGSHERKGAPVAARETRGTYLLGSSRA